MPARNAHCKRRVPVHSTLIAAAICFFVYVSALVFVVPKAVAASDLLRITIGNLPTGGVGQPYSVTLTASGGTPPYTWTVSGLPPGLNLNSSTGEISGYPAKDGTFKVTIAVNDSGLETSINTLPMNIGKVALSPLTVSGSNSATGTVGSPFTVTFTAANAVGPCTWVSGTLPPGLSLNNPGTGSANNLTEAITGTPGVPGTYSITITAFDGMGRKASASLNLTVTGPANASGTGTESALNTAPGNWSVDAKGGTLTTPDNLVSIVVPPGAFDQQVALSIAQVPAPYPLIDGFSAASPQWSIQGTQPDKVLEVTLPYDPSALGDLDPGRLGLYRYNAGSWTWVEGKVDPDSNTVTAEISSMGTYTILLNGQVFQDTGSVPWAQTAINTLLGADVISGTAPGQFDPDGDVTRAQFVTLLARVARLTPGGTTPFTDVPSTAWYAPYVAAAYNYGLVGGTSFEPDVPVTREQMAAWVGDLLGDSAPVSEATQYTDYSAIDAWAVHGVNAVLGSSIMGGFPDGTFRPHEAVTRAQAAVVLYNYLQFMR